MGISYGANPLTCPVRALQDWRLAAGVSVGPVFRPVDRHGRIGSGRLSDKAVALVIKRTAFATAKVRGLDDASAEHRAAQFSGHSLRAAHVTAAAAAGVHERVILPAISYRAAG